MTYSFNPKGVCSQQMIFEIDDNNVIESAKVIGGCNGNLQGICSLVKGQKIEDVIERLDGIHCGFKPTSCPDQMAKGLKVYLEQQ